MRKPILVAVVLTIGSGCPEPAPEPDKVCAPNATEACTCPGGEEGLQTCQEDGTAWSECDCTGQTDAGVLPDGGGSDGALSDGSGAHECSVPRDCGAGFDCVLGPDGYRVCVKLFCLADSDCDQAAGEHCDRRRGLCLLDICRIGVVGICPAGKVCLGGLCSDPPPPADSCEISPSSAVVRAGETVSLSVVGFMTSGAMAPLATFTWSSDTESCATVDADGTVTGAAGASSTCTTTVTATPVGGGTACTATVTSFPAVSLPELRALVIDSLDGAPVSGAQLLVRTDDGSGGNLVQLPVATTDANGVAAIADVGTAVAANILDVSVFHSSYSYITVVRPGSSDLVFYLHEVADETTMAGVRSISPDGIDFSEVEASGDIALGFAGLSAPGFAGDVPALHQVGLLVQRDLNLEGIGDFDDAPFPSGMYIEVSAAAVKPDFQSFGAPGKRCLWGLAGKVQLAEIGPVFAEVSAESGYKLTSALFRAVLQRLPVFSHGLVGGIELVEVSRPSSGEPKDWDFGTDTAQLHPAKLLSQTVTVQIPTLPTLPGSSTDYMHGVIVTAASMVPGQGHVLLGLGAGYDAPEDTDPVDGVVDPLPCPQYSPGCPRTASGEVFVDFAPPHDGLEGTSYVFVATARDLRQLDRLDGPFSLLFKVTNSPGAINSFPATAFLGFASGASYVAGLSYQQSATLAGADFYRLALDTDGRAWHVYLDDPVAGVALPTPPGGMESRTANARVEAFRAFSSSFGVADLVQLNSTNLDQLGTLVAAFSSHACRAVEQPVSGSCDGGADYTLDTETGLCVGGPDDIVAFAAGTSSPCSGMSGYEPVYTSGAGSAGICARTPACRTE